MSSRKRNINIEERNGTSSASRTNGKAKSTTGATKFDRKDRGGWGGFGGYMAAKKQKLDSQFNNERGLQSHIFDGIAIYVDGYTKPSSDELRRLVMEHGGRYEQYLMKTVVTHIIATSLPNSKMHSLRDFKVVKPDWIIDSIKAGRLLSHAPYKLYTRQGNSLAAFSAVLTRSASTSSGPKESADRAESLSEVLGKDGEENVESEPLDIDFEGEDFENCDVDGISTNVIPPDVDAEVRESCNSESLPAEEFSPSSDQPAFSERKRKASVSQHSNSQHSKPKHLPTSPSNLPLSTSSTSPKHNKSIPKAGDPKFLSEFYSHSRLHHISTWGAEFRAYVSKLQKESSGSFPGRDQLRQLHVDRMVERGLEQTLLSARRGKPQRVIMHIDMDCFFVSVGLLNYPEYRGKPVAVTHSRGKGLSEPIPGSNLAFEKSQWRKRGESKGKRGKKSLPESEIGTEFDEENLATLPEPHSELDFMVPSGSTGKDTFLSLAEIASCSYEARKAGVKNGMFMGKAKQLCPDLLTVPYDFDGYNRVSRILYDTVASYTHDIEAVSCDEMLVDCTDLLADTGATCLEFAELLRQDVAEKTGCTASAGIGSNILLARLATRKAKPNGQFHLQQSDVLEFIKEQPVKDLPGVGWSMTQKLSKIGIETCGELQKISLSALQKQFGPKTGQALYHFCRGEDDRPIRTEKERKSVSAEVNYGIRFQRDREAVKFVEELAGEVSSRLQGIGMKGRTLTLKLMVRRPDAPTETAKFMGHGICNNVSKSTTLPMATDEAGVFAKESVMLLAAMKANSADLRGVGIQVHRLESSDAMSSSTLSKGNQSILNFAVSKQDKTAQDITVEMEKQRGSSTRLESQAIIEEEDGKEQESTEVAGLSSQRRKLRGKTTAPPLPHIPGFSVNSNKDSSQFLLSPSQVDKDVLKELPPDIRRQIEREMRGAKETSRPSSNGRPRKKRQGSDEPSCSHWSTPPDESASDSSQGKKEGSSQSAAIASDPLQLSFSQIDPEVLQELPADIRQQLQQEMLSSRTRRSAAKAGPSLPMSGSPTSDSYCKTSQRRRSSSEVSQSPPHRSSMSKDTDSGGRTLRSRRSSASQPQSSRSRSPSPARSSGSGLGEEVQRETASDVASEPDISPLPNLSQLDPSCMEALPKDMQEEIQAAYARQQRGQPHQQNAQNSFPSPPKCPPVTSGKSRGRGGSRGRGRGRGRGKGSPLLFKVPQGRPVTTKRKDLTPRQLDFLGLSNNVPCPNLPEDCTSKSSTPAPASVPSSVSSPLPSPQGKDLHDEGVNLCGAVTMPEVRVLLSEWLDSTSDPQEQDVNVIVTYLGQLALSKDLEKVDLVLRYLHRKIVKQPQPSWQSTLSSIMIHTQDLVQSAYGSSLKTDWMST